jgi:hypothetical protein
MVSKKSLDGFLIWIGSGLEFAALRAGRPRNSRQDAGAIFSGLAPAALLAVGGNNHWGCVHFAGMIVDGGCGLRAKVAGLRVEVERANAVVTVRASKFHTAFDALDSVGFH